MPKFALESLPTYFSAIVNIYKQFSTVYVVVQTDSCDGNVEL